ncbi:MAG TPA: DUF484 family protein [Burkholderiales bacterium]|nr:DUF484 family protein [Burkholderiales bacterium]
MTPDAVATYLKQHPEFFEQYADMLAEIVIPHPHGGRAIPISERQILTLRDKGKQLEVKLRELIEYGEENDALGEKLHRLALTLIGARDLETVDELLYASLGEDFAVPHIALRLWPEGTVSPLPEFAPVSAGAREFAESLTSPYCGTRAILDTAGWFGEAAPLLKSFAYVALRNGDRTIGLLALASEDAQRFYPEMGTLYLKRLGELIAAAVLRCL